MMTFDEIALLAASKGSSDIHLSSGRPVSCRIDGVITTLEEHILTPEDTQRFADEVLGEKEAKVFYECGDMDFARAIGDMRLRMNIFRKAGAIAIVARILNEKIPSPKDLGIPDAVVAMTLKHRGIVLVTGPTGSGKSTTLASLLNVINERDYSHIITLEDPIEYLHKHKKSIINQREIGNDTGSYAAGLRAALRQDPDVILVGEMRDHETISTAITAAETGHLVFATLHTIGAANTIDRVIDVFEPHQQGQIRTQLADVLQCVVSQQLLPREGGGRIAVLEVMVTTAAVRANIREQKTFQITSAIQTGRRLGMITMDDALEEQYRKGEISRENALLYAQDRAALEKKIGGGASMGLF